MGWTKKKKPFAFLVKDGIERCAACDDGRIVMKLSNGKKFKVVCNACNGMGYIVTK